MLIGICEFQHDAIISRILNLIVPKNRTMWQTFSSALKCIYAVSYIYLEGGKKKSALKRSSFLFIYKILLHNNKFVEKVF